MRYTLFLSGKSDWVLGTGDWERLIFKSREEALEFGQILMERGIIFHVTDEHSFRDEYFFYSFNKSYYSLSQIDEILNFPNFVA